MNASFPEQFRYNFKIQFTYTLTSEDELMERGFYHPCVYNASLLLTYTYKNCTPVIIESASKIAGTNLSGTTGVL